MLVMTAARLKFNIKYQKQPPSCYTRCGLYLVVSDKNAWGRATARPTQNPIFLVNHQHRYLGIADHFLCNTPHQELAYAGSCVFG
jgi:hypothetical protein